jgi:hypothetical protein
MRTTPRSRRAPSTSAEARYTRPKAPKHAGSTVSAMSTIVYQSIWFIVSRSPHTSGAIGTPARP